jgi:hypothetical protein
MSRAAAVLRLARLYLPVRKRAGLRSAVGLAACIAARNSACREVSVRKTFTVRDGASIWIPASSSDPFVRPTAPAALATARSGSRMAAWSAGESAAICW